MADGLQNLKLHSHLERNESVAGCLVCGPYDQGDRRNCRRFSQSDSAASWNSTRERLSLTESAVESSLLSPHECCRLPPVTAYSTLSITKFGHAGILIALIWGLKLIKLSFKALMEKFSPLFTKVDIHLFLTFTNMLGVYITLRIFMYRCAKCTPIANKLKSIANWYNQTFMLVNRHAVLYSILFGQNKYICQKIDQTTAMLENGQKLVAKTYFRPLCLKQAVASKQKAN